MSDSWTTVGLNKKIQRLTKLAITLAEKIKFESHIIKTHADELYLLFWIKHGFEKTSVKELNMNNFISSTQSLEIIINAFCIDPVNVLTEKHFLILRFYLGLGAQIRANFELANSECAQWLNAVIGELKTQIN